MWRAARLVTPAAAAGTGHEVGPLLGSCCARSGKNCTASCCRALARRGLCAGQHGGEPRLPGRLAGRAFQSMACICACLHRRQTQKSGKWPGAPHAPRRCPRRRHVRPWLACCCSLDAQRARLSSWRAAVGRQIGGAAAPPPLPPLLLKRRLCTSAPCPGPHSLFYFRDGEDAEFNLPDMMTPELRAQLDGYADVHEVRAAGGGAHPLPCMGGRHEPECTCPADHLVTPLSAPRPAVPRRAEGEGDGQA